MTKIFIFLIIFCIALSSCNNGGTTQEREKRHLSTYVFSTGLYLEMYRVHESGAGVYDTGTDDEWLLIDSLGNKLSLGITSRDDFLDLRLRKDSLFLTPVNRERDLSDLSEIIYDDKEGETEVIILSDHGFKIKEHLLDLSINPIEELANNMTFIEGGSFNMVSRWSERTNPENLVEVESFKICKYEVTQELWFSVMDYIPALFKDSANSPIENIDWYEAQEFISKLNLKHSTKYRLPTETEWEYAARGGEKIRDYQNWKSDKLDTMAWYRNNSDKTIHPIGAKYPNEYGLYDMIGNLREWCSDWYDSEYSATDSTINQTKVVRGGSWNANYADCNPYERNNFHPKYGHGNEIGLRLVLDLK